MGMFGSLGKRKPPVAPPGAVVDNSMGQRPMRQQPRPSLIVGGPAYFTPEGYEAPRQPEQAFMPTDTRPDPIGEQFRRERPTLPPMPPAITGTDLGLPMNPGIPAPGGVEMGQPFQLPDRSPIGDIPSSFLDFYTQQGMDDEPTGLRKLFGINEFLKKINESKTPDSPENDYFGDMGMLGMSADALKGMGGTPQPSTGGGFFGPRNSEMADDGTQLNNQPFGGLTIEGDIKSSDIPLSEAIASFGRTPGQYSVDPKDDRSGFNPMTALGAPPAPDYKVVRMNDEVGIQETLRSGQNVRLANSGPGEGFIRGLPTQAEMEQLNAGNEEWMSQYGSTPPRQIATPIPNASPVTPEQEVFINGLMPGSGGYLTVPSTPSMPLPMMPAPPAMRPAPPPMMPRQTPNLSTRRMNPRFPPR